jgi:N6-L-threonylcarbamoyladenine synthase
MCRGKEILPLLVLGIESTCDETGVALVDDGYAIRANPVLSQVPLHERFGGVVPEIASRAHVQVITRMLERALQEAGLHHLPSVTPGGRVENPALPAAGVDLVAVANRPGLIGSLLVGLTAAKCLALALDVPIVGVDHVQAHIYSCAMRSLAPFAPINATGVFPAVSLVVSGGHTSLYSSTSWTSHELLGSTLDDAVGEAFDKAANILGLGYPGGPAISRAAADGDRKAIAFPRTLLEPQSLDFSFSGIKTAVLYHAKGQNAGRDGPLRPGVRVADVAAAFETAVVDVLIEKLRRAVRRQRVNSALVSGGVAANQHLRQRLERFSRDESVRVLVPDLSLCTDNGAMIAGMGYRLWQSGLRHDLSLDASPMSLK